MTAACRRTAGIGADGDPVTEGGDADEERALARIAVAMRAGVQ
jgi:hypothetical protein